MARIWARRLLVTPSTLYGKRSLFRKHGPIALLDKTFLARAIYRRPDNLPAPAVARFQELAADGPRSAKAAIQAFRDQLRRWQAGDSTAAIPGYESPPAGDKPPGWSSRNLARLLIDRNPALRAPADQDQNRSDRMPSRREIGLDRPPNLPQTLRQSPRNVLG